MTVDLDRLADTAREGCIACADAHCLAAEAGITPQAFGELVNSATVYRFDRCQLGLFGYGKKGTEAYKIVQPAAYCPPAIVAAIKAQTTAERVACEELWAIAAEHRYPRLAIANIAQALGLKVKPCQLGCF